MWLTLLPAVTRRVLICKGKSEELWREEYGYNLTWRGMILPKETPPQMSSPPYTFTMACR